MLSADVKLDSSLILTPSVAASQSVSVTLTVARDMSAKTKDVLRSLTLVTPHLVDLELIVLSPELEMLSADVRLV